MRIRAFVAGHKGLVGSAFVRALAKLSNVEVITRNRNELDLRDSSAVMNFFAEYQFDWVILAAARVGGIKANIESPCDFLLDNLKIQTNVIEASHRFKSKKLIFFGSNCMYPSGRLEPLDVCDLLTGPLEGTNEPYAIAKIAGWKLCETYNKQYGTNFFTLIPASVIGLNDQYDLDRAHVIPALIRKFYEAKKSGNRKVVIWGSGKPVRQFIWSDDLADIGVKILSGYNYPGKSNAVNVASDIELSVAEIANAIGEIVYPGSTIEFDLSKPDGNLRKSLKPCPHLSDHNFKGPKDFKSLLQLMYSDFQKSYGYHV